MVANSSSVKNASSCKDVLDSSKSPTHTMGDGQMSPEGNPGKPNPNSRKGTDNPKHRKQIDASTWKNWKQIDASTWKNQ